MANTQINIAANGTKTLATAGKYCDRNIDVNVNVPVPSGYIKPSGSKTITANGTHDVTQFASAVVDVAGEPTQFTNLYDVANVKVKTLLSGSSSGASYSTDNNVNCVLVPFHHKKGEPVVLRMRGIGTVRDRYGCVVFAEDGTTRVQHYSFYNSGAFTLSYDEHGDATITFAGGIITNYEWYWFGFNFQYVTVNSGATAMAGPIITINEPIGNGGHV
jgi:hypothetical protein